MRARILVALVVLVVAGDSSAKEAVRRLRAELAPSESAQFAVENLAGSMHVVAGAGNTVSAQATIHARIPELAALVRFERVQGEGGLPTLRVRYPLELHTNYRYPKVELEGGLLLGLLAGTPIRSEYEGKRVTISDRKGALLWVDVEVEVPSHMTLARFRSVVGAMDGRGLSGSLRFETGFGAISLAQVRGEVVADTGSGNVSAEDVVGSFKCDAGNGDCAVTRFSGDALTCITSSGQVRILGSSGRSVAIDTGSGSVQMDDVDATEVSVDTGSGNVDLTSPAKRLARVKAVTGSGAVRLHLSKDAEFEARAGLGSGRIQSRYKDADPIVRKLAIVGYRRGDGRIKIEVEMGSGSLLLEPARPPGP